MTPNPGTLKTVGFWIPGRVIRSRAKGLTFRQLNHLASEAGARKRRACKCSTGGLQCFDASFSFDGFCKWVHIHIYIYIYIHIQGEREREIERVKMIVLKGY